MLQATIEINGIVCDYRTRLPLGITDGLTSIGIDSVVNANITVMDAKSNYENALNPRQLYIDKLNKPSKSGSVLLREYREKNRKAALVGLTSYLPVNPAHPEN